VKPKRPSWVGLFIGLRGFCKRAQKFSLGHVLAVAYGSGLASFQENLGLELWRAPQSEAKFGQQALEGQSDSAF
jgi:hypothetical protein